ncbi:hypothetical protein BC567DRAFT_206246 [Phyllosticta citribraziliensis]
MKEEKIAVMSLSFSFSFTTHEQVHERELEREEEVQKHGFGETQSKTFVQYHHLCRLLESILRIHSKVHTYLTVSAVAADARLTNASPARSMHYVGMELGTSSSLSGDMCLEPVQAISGWAAGRRDKRPPRDQSSLAVSVNALQRFLGRGRWIDCAAALLTPSNHEGFLLSSRVARKRSTIVVRRPPSAINRAIIVIILVKPREQRVARLAHCSVSHVPEALVFVLDQCHLHIQSWWRSCQHSICAEISPLNASGR